MPGAMRYAVIGLSYHDYDKGPFGGATLKIAQLDRDDDDRPVIQQDRKHRGDNSTDD